MSRDSGLPGDAGRPPNASPPAGTGDADSGWLLRALSIVPFLIAGAIAAIAAATWLIVLVFGLGIDRETAWRWAAGRPASEIVPQVGLLLALGAACVAFLIGSIWAGMVSLRDAQPPWFWPLAAGTCVLLGLTLLAGEVLAPATIDEIGLSRRDRYFALGVVGYSIVVIGMRRRRARGRRISAERRHGDG